MNYQRLIELKINQSYFLLGPRGTGKTTYLQEKFPFSLTLDLLRKDLYLELLQNPDKLEDLILPGITHVIIDEVQRIPDLLDTVHRLIEKKKIHFILTGSSARKLRKANTNLLAGRALQAFLFPLTAQELGQDFQIKTYLLQGGLPSLYDSTKDLPVDQYLKTYIESYLREEIQSEGLTKSLPAFLRFLEVASFSQGEVTNFSEIAREAQISRKMVQSYFEILEDLLIGFFLPVFSKRAKRKMITHQKFYFFDVGIYQHIRPRGFLDGPENILGSAMETLVIQNIRALNSYMHLRLEIYFWRTSSGEEVDFVLYGEKNLIAIEVKASEKFHSKDLKGLKEFKIDYPMAQLYLVYAGVRREYVDGIHVIPIQEFLASEFPAKVLS